MHWLFEQARDWAVRRCWTHDWPTTSSACRTGGTRAFRRRQSSCCVLESRTRLRQRQVFLPTKTLHKFHPQSSDELLFQIKKGKQVPLCRPGSPSCCEGAAAASTRARSWRSFIPHMASATVACPRALAARRRQPHRSPACVDAVAWRARTQANGSWSAPEWSVRHLGASRWRSIIPT